MSINTVTLSPSGEGDKLSFVGTNADERVIFSNPDRLYYAADLNLSGGNDQLASSDWMLEWARILAGNGNDQVSLVAEYDLLVDGGADNDTLKARADYHVGLVGGTGDDRLEAITEGAASVDGGTGNDTITGGALESYDASGGEGNDTIRVRMGEGTLDGGKGNDLIEFTTDGYAGKAAYGGDGNDTIRYAATQGEEISPEMIIDLWGGAGTDKLRAGAAQDLLHFTPANSPAGKTRDLVFGFDGDSDRLLPEGDANRGKSGEQDYAFVGETKTVGAGQVGFYESGNDTIVRGSDGKTTFEIQLEAYQGGLTALDFDFGRA